VQERFLMLENGIALEREATRLLPELLGELFGEPPAHFDIRHGEKPGRGVNVIVSDGRGVQWIVEVKGASGPGLVDRVASQLHAFSGEDTPLLLVVPFMTRAGAEAAARAGINWLDLSGNAHIRVGERYVHVEGRPSRFRSRGRPSSPFAPKSARVARALLNDPRRWWRQKDLAETTGLDDGSISRVVRRLDEEHLLERRDRRELRPRDPALMLDAWAQDYRFDRHDIVPGHVSGAGIEVARQVADRLRARGIHHAFTGLPAAWAMDRFAQFRLNTVYVEGDPRLAGEKIEMRLGPKGANVQLVGPDDSGIFIGEEDHDGLNCVTAAQTYLDLLHLPERAPDAAEHLRERYLKAYASAG
jgi:hypothetical protein